MPKSVQYPSYTDCVAQALSSSATPLMMDELVDRVAAQRPLSKSARSAIYQAIDRLYQAVPVGQGQFGWVSRLLTHNYFRHQLTGSEARRGFLVLDELEHIAFSPQFFQTQRAELRKLTLELSGGPTIPATLGIERNRYSLLMGPEFVKWLDLLGGQARDDLLIQVQDAVGGHYTLRLQPRELRDGEQIQAREMRLAHLAEELVAEDRKVRFAMPTWELVARMIGRGLFLDPVPPGELRSALHRYSNLRPWGQDGYTLSSRASTVAPVDVDAESSQPVEEWFLFDEPETGPELEADDWIGHMADDLFDQEPNGADEGSCGAYEEYLDALYQSGTDDTALSHDDYHLLEAELETLINLEYEFGYLLPDQTARKQQLAERLFIDPDSLLDDDIDAMGFDEPPYWEN